MSNYKNVSAYAEKNGHYNMCAPIAMALASGESFDDCHEMLSLLGLRKGKRGCTAYGGLEKALHELGFNTKRQLIPGHVKTNITLRGKLNKNKNYVIQYRGHVAAHINGKIEDWTESRRNRIIGILEVSCTDGEVGQYLGCHSDLGL